MFVAFPLETKSSEAGGSNTALGAFNYWTNPAVENSCDAECYLSSAEIYAGLSDNARCFFIEVKNKLKHMIEAN
jgi:hypothetical protein